jgi:hypothetical protein
MKDKEPKTKLLAAAAICALGAMVQPTGSRADEAAVQLAASDSYWCQLFPSSCGDETTPGGAQNVPEPGGPAGDAPMAPSSARGMDNDASETSDSVPAETPPSPTDEAVAP